MKTGSYTFCFGEELGSEGQVFLEYVYEPSSASSLVKEEPQEETYIKEKWNSEQIRDFVRKLRFIVRDDDEGRDHIKHFLYLNQVNISN